MQRLSRTLSETVKETQSRGVSSARLDLLRSQVVPVWHHHRGVTHMTWPYRRKKRARKLRRPRAPVLDLAQILGWADAYHASMGRWPTLNSGRVAGTLGETWRRVDQAVSDVIDQTTFAELARNWRDQQSKYVPNWEI